MEMNTTKLYGLDLVYSKQLDVNCLLCGGEVNLKTIKQKGYQEGELYSIYHCPSCNASFSLPRPNTDSIYQLIYQNVDRVPGYSRYWIYYNEIRVHDSPIEYLLNSEPTYWSLIYSLKRVLNTPKDAFILEVGSGLGYLTYALRKDGYINAFGLEIAQDAVDKATKELGQFYICADARKYAKISSQKYDVIFMTEVIEHIDNPMGLIDSLIPLLNDGGTLVMTTPDKSIFPDNVYWATEKPPIHCWWFSDKSFRYIAKCFNMKASFVDFTEYYKNHKRELLNLKIEEALSNNCVFDKNNRLIESMNINTLKSFRILPGWIKKTYMYKKLAPSIYPLLSKSLIRVDKSKSIVLCALLTKAIFPQESISSKVISSN